MAVNHANSDDDTSEGSYHESNSSAFRGASESPAGGRQPRHNFKNFPHPDAYFGLARIAPPR